MTRVRNRVHEARVRLGDFFANGDTMTNTVRQPELEKNDVLFNGLEVLAFARRVTMGLIEELDDKTAFHRPFPAGNHAIWIAGHIAWDDDFFLTGLASKPSKLPEKWASLFCSGSSVHDRVDEYPSLADVLQRMEVLRGDVRDWFGSMSSSDLANPLSDGFQRFGASYGALMGTLAWHEGLHAGQLTVIRKSLGLAPRFG